jgi:hypothetical protein
MNTMMLETDVRLAMTGDHDVYARIVEQSAFYRALKRAPTFAATDFPRLKAGSTVLTPATPRDTSRRL